jgi:SSS family solute:Na+ symporter
MRSRVYTMPEFLERRFSPTARVVLSVTSLLTHVLTKFAVSIFAGGVVFRTLLPEVHMRLFGVDWNAFWIGSVSIVVLTGVYTVLGGMRAVAYTEALQTFVLAFGSALLTVFGLIKLGGWQELRAALIPAGVEGTWAPVKETGRMAWYFNTNYPWLGMLFCAPIIGLWYWCTDQYIVQRALGAPDERTARRGTIFASFLKLLPVFIFIIPGMIALAGGRGGPGGVPDARDVGAARGRPRRGRGRPHRGADEFDGRRVQRLEHAVHDGPVPEVAAQVDAE